MSMLEDSLKQQVCMIQTIKERRNIYVRRI